MEKMVMEKPLDMGVEAANRAGPVLGYCRQPVWEERVRSLGHLAEAGKWGDLAKLAEQWIPQVVNDAQTVAALQGWMALATVRSGGDVAAAESMSRQSLEVLGMRDGTALAFHACVLMALGREDEAEKIIGQAEAHRPTSPGVKTLAHLRVELCRRRGDDMGRKQWEKVAAMFDLKGVYRPFGGKK